MGGFSVRRWSRFSRRRMRARRIGRGFLAPIPIFRRNWPDMVYGLLEWTATINDVPPGSVPQVVPAKDVAGGFVVAVDQQDATGTLGVHVRREGSLP